MIRPGATLCVAAVLAAASARAQAPDSAATPGPPRLQFPPLSATGRAPASRAPIASPDSLPARAAAARALPDPAQMGGHELAAELARRAPWMLRGGAAADGWRGVAPVGLSPRALSFDMAGMRWRDPLEAGLDGATLSLWPWRLASEGTQLTAVPSLVPALPAQTLVGYARASDGAHDLQAAVAGRAFGDADVTGWIATRDADRTADGGAFVEDRAEFFQIARPHGTADRVSLTVASLPSTRLRSAAADAGDGAGIHAVQTTTTSRPRAVQAAWSRSSADAESLRVAAFWGADQASVVGSLDGGAWSESMRGGAMRLESDWSGGRGGLWWASAQGQRETLRYSSTAASGKATGAAVSLADTARSRAGGECSVGVRRAFGAHGELRCGVRVAAPGEGAIFAAPVFAVRVGSAIGGGAVHAAYEPVVAAATLLEPVRRVSEASGAVGAVPVERAGLLRAGARLTSRAVSIEVEVFDARTSGFAVRGAGPLEAAFAVRRASATLAVRGATASARWQLGAPWSLEARGMWVASSESVRTEAELPRSISSWVTRWDGRCLGVDCAAATALTFTPQTPSRVPANVVPSTFAWDANCAIHLQGVWIFVRGENLAQRPLGPVSAPGSTSARLMAGVLLSLRD